MATTKKTANAAKTAKTATVKKPATTEQGAKVVKKTSAAVLKTEKEIQESMGASTMTTREKLANLKAQQKALREQAKALRSEVTKEKGATVQARKDNAKFKKHMVSDWATMRKAIVDFNAVLFHKDATPEQLETLLADVQNATSVMYRTATDAAHARSALINAANGITPDENDVEEDDGLLD